MTLARLTLFLHRLLPLKHRMLAVCFGAGDDARSRAEILCRETGPAVIALNVACKLRPCEYVAASIAACTLDEGN